MAIATCMAVRHAILCGFERFAKRPISPCKTAHIAARNGPFHHAKRPISQHETAHFANGYGNGRSERPLL